MLYHAGAKIENLTDETDDLIERAQSGDDEAFGLIFERHQRFVYKFVYAMVGDGGLAEELTQETFLGAYQNIRSLRNEAKLQTWLCAIAKNVVYKSFRARGREAASSGEIEAESFDVRDEKNVAPDRQFLSRELNHLISAALRKLDDDKRLVFTLKELQNLSYREISEITGYAIPKLKTDLRRAKAEMRATLRPVVEAKR